MGGQPTQRTLFSQQSSLLDVQQRALYFAAMTYGERLSKAMLGRFSTNQELADALTKLLKSQGRYTKDIPDATIQAARTRQTGSSYTLDFAHLCGVDAYWLAHGIGTMRPASLARIATEDPLLGELLDVWDRLSQAQRGKVVGYAAGIPSGPPADEVASPFSTSPRSGSIQKRNR